MLQFLLILSVACVHLYDTVEPVRLATRRHPEETAFLVFALFACLGFGYWVIQVVCGWLVDRGDGSAFRLAGATGVGVRAAGLASLVYSVYVWGWPDAVRAYVGDLILVDEIIACLPFWCLIAWMWWAQHPIERRAKEATLHRRIADESLVQPFESRGASVWTNFRQQALVWLLPILMLAAWSEGLDKGVEALGAPGSLAVVEVVRLVGSLVILAIAPAGVRRTWKTVELGEGPLRSRIRSVVDAYRIRTRGPFVWSAPDDSVNAAVVGFVFPVRYLLVSRAMLESFEDRPLAAVIAHEVAHLKLHHMVWLGLTVLAAVGACGWAVTLLDAFVPDLRPFLGEVPVSIATLLAVFLTFGVVSRRFEWQADAFAVRHVAVRIDRSERIDAAACEAMSAALAQVAFSNAIRMTQWSWRHGSLAERIRRVRSLIGAPAAKMFSIDRQVVLIRVVTIITIILSYAPLLWQHLPG